MLAVSRVTCERPGVAGAAAARKVEGWRGDIALRLSATKGRVKGGPTEEAKPAGGLSKGEERKRARVDPATWLLATKSTAIQQDKDEGEREGEEGALKSE